MVTRKYHVFKCVLFLFVPTLSLKDLDSKVPTQRHRKYKYVSIFLYKLRLVNPVLQGNIKQVHWKNGVEYRYANNNKNNTQE